MAQIKDWTIATSGNRSEIFTSEKGDRFLIKDEQDDVAFIKQGGENIVIQNGSISVIIDDANKKITIYR
ncbi:hypothetical protein [Paenibacillus sp. 8b26]|uniref:hypothetical protein n=1 Tax=Paenibacillus sp. 8b26 TaxID=3424133 RepID=UPI003D651E06